MKKKIAIIGGGPGGYSAALTAAKLGGDVTLLEKEEIGGVCLNWGCIPSKIMKHTADLLEGCQRGSEFGLLGAENIGLDLQALHARKRKVIAEQTRGIDALLAKACVRRIAGKGTVQKPGILSVTTPSKLDQEIAWDKLIIASGSTPLNIPAFPFDGNRILSSDDIVWSKKIPATLVIVGGGVIGCEFAFIMSSFGVKVTLVEGMARLLPFASVDQECSKILLRQMKKAGISVFLNSAVCSVKNLPTKAVVYIKTEVNNMPSKKEITLTAESVLVCVGRKANTDALGLEKCAIAVDTKGWIEVNAELQTGHEDVYAIGDVLGPKHVMLAHVAVREGQIAAANSVQDVAKKMSYQTIPTTIFSRPEIGCAGVTEETAKEMGLEVVCQSALFRSCPKSHVLGEIDGMAKVVAKKEGGQIVGVHIIGPHASDLIAEGVMAISKNCTVTELADQIHAHPTLGEIMAEFSPSDWKIS